MVRWLVSAAALCISFMASAQCLFDSASRRPDVFYVNMDGRDSVAVWKTVPACGSGSADEASCLTGVQEKFAAFLYGVECEMSLRDSAGCRIMSVRLTNTSGVPFQPVKAGIKLGIDTYMDSYPEWLDRFFPTMLYCEKTHFYGYFQSPSGKLLGIASPDPVASWSLDYNLGYPEPEPYWFWGHRVEAVNIDLMNALPLPERHPRNLWELGPGEAREWTLYCIFPGKDDTSEVSSGGTSSIAYRTLEENISRIAGIPLISMERKITATKIIERNLYIIACFLLINSCVLT